MDLDPQNQDAYDDLITAIEAGGQRLGLLIAVCDDSRLREAIIQNYETELSPHWQCHRATLAHDKPSIKTAIADAVSPDLSQPCLVTVLGAEQLHFLKFDEEKSEQEEFLGYLQWTREALREFQFPVVLWLTNQLVAQVSKSAKDFWSWRKDVFRFSSKKTTGVSEQDLGEIRSYLTGIEIPDEDAFALPISDLEKLIQQAEAKDPEDPLLAPLYSKAGLVYGRRLEGGQFQNYQAEQKKAINYSKKAAALQRKLGDQKALSKSLLWLGALSEKQGLYAQAESYYLQAKAIQEQQEDKEDLASTLSLLGRLYRSQGRYSEAEPLYQQTLQLRQKFLGNDHPAVASSLNNLATLYDSQGRYSEAEPLYLQALHLSQKLLGDDHPDVATCLNNLAELYRSQGRYSEAEPLYQKCFEIDRVIYGDEHPYIATNLNNLGLLYKSQDRFQEAEPLLTKALVMRDRILGPQHPDTISTRESLENLKAAMNPES